MKSGGLTIAQKRSRIFNILKLLKSDTKDKIEAINKCIVILKVIRSNNARIIKKKKRLYTERTFFYKKLKVIEDRIDKIVFG